MHAPAIRIVPLSDDTELVAATRRVLEAPVDLVVATTGVGFRGWLEAADAWDLPVVEHLSGARVLWRHLLRLHESERFNLLLHGGDQIYADEATHGHPLSDGWPDRIPDDPAPADLDGLTRHLERRFVQRYLMVLAAEGCADLFASVPSLSVWDDHDICDGRGSRCSPPTCGRNAIVTG